MLVSDQSGIARGIFDERQLRQIHERLRALLGDADAALDAIYFCPHSPEHDCDCRKPKPGMISRAARDLGFDPHDAFVVGDKKCDMELGRRVGSPTFLVRTSYGQETSLAGVQTDYAVPDICEAAAAIIRRVTVDAKANVS